MFVFVESVQRSFSKLMELAMSSERLDRRLSLLGPDLDDGMLLQQQQRQQECVQHRHSSFRPQEELRSVEKDIDKLILEAAGMIRDCNNSNSSNIHGPSARHIRNRKNSHLQQQQQQRQHLRHPALGPPRSLEDDLDLPPSPVPPCPPLRGEVLYSSKPDDPVYVTRDDLYCRQQQQQLSVVLESQQNWCQAQTLPPKPPQRTVSFMATGTLPRKMSQIKDTIRRQRSFHEEEARGGGSNHSRIYSDTDLRHHHQSQQQRQNLSQQQQRNSTIQRLQSPMISGNLHARSYSSPAPLYVTHPQDLANTSGDSDTPSQLPPPPYIAPPAILAKSVSSVAPLPPPPQSSEVIQLLPQAQPPCNSASSSSSIDSG